MKVPAVLSITFLAIVCFVHAEDKIPLSLAIENGLSQDFEWRNAQLDLELTENQKQLREMEKRFSLGFEAGYRYQSQTMEILTPTIQIPGIPAMSNDPIEAGLHHNFDLKLSLIQPIFTGGVLSNSVHMQDIRRAIDLNRRELKRIEITDKIKSSYFTYRILIQKKQSLLLLRKTLMLHRDRLQDFYAEGLARKTDLLETLSAVEEINLNINDLERSLENEMRQFMFLSGHSPDQIQENYSETAADLAESLEFFITHHPILLSLRKRIESETIQRRISNGRHAPQVFGFAEMHYGKPGIDFFKKEWSLYFQGGISLKIPVFNWGKKGNESRVFDIQIKKLENQEKQFLREVESGLEKLYSSRKILAAKLVLAQNILEYAGEEAELKSGLYQERQITNREYLDSLFSRERHLISHQEIKFQMELINVKINSLIGHSKEEK